MLSFVPLILSAQTDSLYREEFTKQVNAFRKGKSMKPLQLTRRLNLSAETIAKKSIAFKDAKGVYIKDSILAVLRKNHIYDYQYVVLEKAKTNNQGFIADNTISSELQNALNDSLHNTIGLVSNSDKELVILAKHYVDINPSFGLKYQGPDNIGEFQSGKKYRSKCSSVIITGQTSLTNIKVKSFDLTSNIVSNTPIDSINLSKDINNKFNIEIDISKNRQKTPKVVCLNDSLGNILTLIPIFKH